MALTPFELLDLIAALVPPPRVHRHRYCGVLAPNAPLRAAVTALARMPVPMPAAGTPDAAPLHYDEKAAGATPFEGIVVQGGVTSAILNATVAEDLPGPGTVFLQVNWSFKAPVRPGDTITAEVKVTKVREDKPITELETRVLLADGTDVLNGTAACYMMPIKTT